MSYKYENDAIKRFGRQFEKRKDGTELIFPCPKCNAPNKSNKLYVNVTSGVFHCFRCGFKGRLKTNYSLSDVIKNKNDKQEYKKSDIFLFPFIRKNLTEEQINALYLRGLSDSDIRYYNITGGNRIQIPNYVIGNFTDMICKWEWRKELITNKNPKYLYLNDVKKSDIVFNLHNIQSNSDQITICEGIFNAITAGKTAVATYGCNFSSKQIIDIVNKQPKSIIIAYDSDLPGVTGSMKLIQELKNQEYQGNVYYILLPKGIDINDLGYEQYQDYFNKNKVLIDLSSALSCKLPKLLFNR